MPKIQQLSPHVADLIAAGEVVERPASAAKELVENAIDAGAHKVTVELRDGGMTFLRVTDDGCGMAAEDVETAFLRHATSKLHEAADLEAIHTLGFRGEALAAISSVSRIDVLTKTADAPFGTSLHLEAGVVTERGEAGCPNGTTMLVRDLFYNTPARMKFMKRDSVEASAVLSTVQRLALAHPEVAVRVLRDGQEQLSTPGDGKLLSAIYAVMGRQTAQEMVPVDGSWDKLSVTGFVTRPAATRGTRGSQIFFVNGRHVRSKLMTAALEQAYRNQLLQGRFPACVLHLHLPEHLVDVNVHPAKTEVRFLREQEVFDCVHYGVLGALEQASGRVQMKLKPQNDGNSAFRTMSAAEYRAAAAALQDGPRPAASRTVLEQIGSLTERRDGAALASPKPVQPVTRPEPPCPAPQPAAPELREAPVQMPPPQPKLQTPTQREEPPVMHDEPVPPEPKQTEEPQQELPLPKVPDYRIIGEALNTYILVEQAGSLLLIDKHAAHERILFEKLRADTEPVMPQLLLTPVLCEPEREEAAVLLENAELLAQYGYEISDYGDGVLAIRQIPTEIAPDDAAQSLTALAAELLTGRHADPTELRDRLLHTIACKAAIKGGWHTDPKEWEAVVHEVLTRNDLKYCPHGRPICLELTASQLERQFKRA